MKKIIVVLIIILGGVLAGLIHLMTNDTYGYTREVMQIDNPFTRDEKANELIEYINSLDRRNYGEKNTGNIHGERQRGVIRISISERKEAEFKTQVEKIERVLELEGLTENIYNIENINKEKNFLNGLETGKSVETNKLYGDILVATSLYTRYEQESEYNRGISIIIPREKIQDSGRAALSERLKGEGYYLKDFVVGGADEMFIFVNQAEMVGINRADILLDENRQVATESSAEVRYEILANQGKVEYVKGIAEGRKKINFSEEDKEMLLRAANELGFGESEVMQLSELLGETLENPMKNRKEKIGGWEYQAKYNKRNSGEDEVIFLEIILK